MVDTYGAGLEEVRGFLQGGWGACMNAEGECTSNDTAVCSPVLTLVKYPRGFERVWEVVPSFPLSV